MIIDTFENIFAKCFSQVLKKQKLNKFFQLQIIYQMVKKNKKNKEGIKVYKKIFCPLDYTKKHISQLCPLDKKRGHH